MSNTFEVGDLVQVPWSYLGVDAGKTEEFTRVGKITAVCGGTITLESRKWHFKDPRVKYPLSYSRFLWKRERLIRLARSIEGVWNYNNRLTNQNRVN